MRLSFALSQEARDFDHALRIVCRKVTLLEIDHREACLLKSLILLENNFDLNNAHTAQKVQDCIHRALIANCRFYFRFFFYSQSNFLQGEN